MLKLNTKPGWATLSYRGAWVALIALPLSIIGFRLAFWDFNTTYLLLTASFALAALFLIAGIVLWIKLTNAGQKPALDQAIKATIMSVTILVVLITGSIGAFYSPYIHDISTDLDQLPQFDKAIALRGTESNTLFPPPNTRDYISEQQRLYYPDVEPILSPKSPAEAFEHALSLANSLGWEVINQDQEQGLIEVVDTTLIFGFKDDLVIRIKATEEGSRIDLRSVSRIGMSDLGKNADRIKSFTDIF